MRRSTGTILTTHVGSLPDSADLSQPLEARVAEVVRKQREAGLDIVNEGEYAKGGDWLSYMDGRFAGYTERPQAAVRPMLLQGKDREEFADFYNYATERGTLFYTGGQSVQMRTRRPHYVCTGPIAYRAQAELAREIELLKAHVAPEDAFLTTTAPASLEVYRSENEFYKTEEEYLYALAEAMRVEFETIAAAGLVMQVDDAWLPALWDRIGMKMGMDAYRKWCLARVDALNHALAKVPEAQIRYHLCWGSWHGPHAYDLEMKDFVDIMLRVKAEAYSFEAANARHEHEYAVWETVKLPEGKIVMPGVITHSTDVVEHPELVSQRIRRFAALVGKENVIASADCGFGGRSHPQIAWAKLKSLSEGAALASKALRYT
jgi:5-methyltetrahydropteroyltriglutamate--homocysteine methyltransferase